MGEGTYGSNFQYRPYARQHEELRSPKLHDYNAVRREIIEVYKFQYHDRLRRALGCT